MKQRKYQDFVGFRFGQYHSSEFGLKVISSSSRYEKNLIPNPTDYSNDIAGGDGQYYFGSTFKGREFSVNVAFDDIDEETWRKLSQILATDKLQDLVFDELPFKTYKAKIKSQPDFKFICFDDKEKGKRIYKGEGKITFVCYYPYAFGFDKYVVRAADNYYTPHKVLPKIDDIALNYRYSYGGTKYTYRTEEDYYQLDSGYLIDGGVMSFSGDTVVIQPGVGSSFYGNLEDLAIWFYINYIGTYPNLQKIIATDGVSDTLECTDFSVSYDNQTYLGKTGIPGTIGQVYVEFSYGTFYYNNGQSRKFAKIYHSGSWHFACVPFNLSEKTPTKIQKISYTDVETPYVSNIPLISEQQIYGIEIPSTVIYGRSNFIWPCYKEIRVGGLYKNGNEYYSNFLGQEEVPQKSYYSGEIKKIYQSKEQRTYLATEHYNVEGNMNTPWKTGFPTQEQVELGELYFIDPKDNTKKLIVDTRAYWNNVPEWQPAAQLLISPTLDQDGDLIFLPQYSKVNYYNMDIGLSNKNGLIGSRLLVYNPGDLPIDFELKMGNLSSSLRRNLDQYKFRISRYNVQRLTIEQAVDWTKLKPVNKYDHEKFKYGDKYFKIIEPQQYNVEHQENCMVDSTNWNFNPYIRELGCAHPKHTYIVEPIPREKMSHFIKLFYWQSENYQHTENFEKGIEMANRYQELYDNCINDEERYELYWKTLKDLISEYSYLSLEDYIYNPPEYFIDNDLNYGEFDFNINSYPSFYTYDYFEITNDNFNEIHGGEISVQSEPNREFILPLFLNSEKHMLYNINEATDHYNFNISKTIHNDNIIKGHWFKIPPGWSLIDISPIVDNDKWGGKRWLDARPFDWGTTNENYRNWYDKVYQAAAVDYVSQNITSEGILTGKVLLNDQGIVCPIDALDYNNYEKLKNYFSSIPLEQLENFIQFNRWFNYNYTDIYSDTNFLVQLDRKRADWTEIGFLKTLANYWHVNIIQQGKATGNVDDWWWYANNYIWGNFPPLYWGYADLLNHAQIKYVPLFY